MKRFSCDCKHGYCTGYLPENLFVLQCTKTTDITSKQCPCKQYEQRPPDSPTPDTPGCCDGENKTAEIQTVEESPPEGDG